ncbi:MAG TPA: cytochrome c-type biogenesis protein CcmH [Burkholderiales bacterium]|nr:cytochrome c-type biogenesis protein CcmH [Burkholderiales bacterium]
MKRLLLALSLFFVFVNIQAKEAVPVSADPAIEKRMIALSQNLRCLVCQNESLAASQAELALDLKQEIREMMKKGESDKQIVAYLVHRYGDFVLYKPPVKSTTLLLWFGPFIFLFAGLVVLFFTIQKRRTQIEDISLSQDEERRAQSLLEHNQ